jgi:hypothetical protein
MSRTYKDQPDYDAHATRRETVWDMSKRGERKPIRERTGPPPPPLSPLASAVQKVVKTLDDKEASAVAKALENPVVAAVVEQAVEQPAS